MRGSAITTVVLARHGETEWNRSGRRQGRLDSPLTERGLAHARAVAEGAAGLAVDSVFTAPMTALGWHHPHDVLYRVAVGEQTVTELRVGPS